MKKTIAKYTCSVGLVIAFVLSMQGDNLRSSERGLSLIGNEEGCRTQPYTCPADVLTVGIGTTEAVMPINPNKIYSLEEIAQAFAKGVQQAETCVNRFANGKNMPQGAFEALTSITFNVGCGKMQKSTLFKMARQGYSPAMCDQFLRWRYANGNILKGLENRREKERTLCLTP